MTDLYIPLRLPSEHGLQFLYRAGGRYHCHLCDTVVVTDRIPQFVDRGLHRWPCERCGFETAQTLLETPDSPLSS